MLRRVSIGGLDTDLRFADILLADVLTSYAKVFGDTWILLCMSLFTGRQATTSLPDRSCGGGFAVPFIMALPYLIRLRQCLTEYFRVSGKVSRKEANVHLWNAGKYSSAFPVILMSALQRGWDPEQNHVINIIGMETIW